MVKCKNCKNLGTKDNGFDAYSWCKEINDCPQEDIERDCGYYVPMTNADRIRSMTENEAKKVLERDLRIQIENGALLDGIEALTVAIKVLEEVQQYRQIGTVEECREAVEKQTAKKPEFVDTRFMNNGKHISDGCQLQKCYKCPNCNQHIFHVWDDELYCKYCGQLLDWSDDDETD